MQVFLLRIWTFVTKEDCRMQTQCFRRSMDTLNSLVLHSKCFLTCDIEKNCLFIYMRLFTAIWKRYGNWEKCTKFNSFLGLNENHDTFFVCYTGWKWNNSMICVFIFGWLIILYWKCSHQKGLLFFRQLNGCFNFEQWLTSRCISRGSNEMRGFRIWLLQNCYITWSFWSLCKQKVLCNFQIALLNS